MRRSHGKQRLPKFLFGRLFISTGFNSLDENDGFAVQLDTQSRNSNFIQILNT